MEATVSQVDLVPAKRTQLGGSQPMPEGQQDHGGVPLTMAIVASRLHQALDFALGEVFAGSIIGVPQPASCHCSVLDGWSAGFRRPFHWAIPPFLSVIVPIKLLLALRGRGIRPSLHRDQL